MSGGGAHVQFAQQWVPDPHLASVGTQRTQRTELGPAGESHACFGVLWDTRYAKQVGPHQMVGDQAHRAPFAKDPRIRQHLEVAGVLGAGGGVGPHTLPIDPAWENVGKFRNQSHLGSGFVCGVAN